VTKAATVGIETPIRPLDWQVNGSALIGMAPRKHPAPNRNKVQTLSARQAAKKDPRKGAKAKEGGIRCAFLCALA
jgi:hypothetical protein